jgi:hypothetical protein
MKASVAPAEKFSRSRMAAQHHDQWEQAPPVAAAPAGDVQRGPLEEPGLVEQQRDDDERHEGEGGVPDDVPDHRHVGPADGAGSQGQHGAAHGGPADAEPAWLPDDQDEGEYEDGQGQHVQALVRMRTRGIGRCFERLMATDV